MGYNATIHAKDDGVQDSLGRDTWQPVKSTNGALHVTGAAGGLTAADIEVTTWTATTATLTAATSGTVLAANADRIRFNIYNPTAAVLYLRGAAGAASATVFTWVVPAGAQYISDPFEYAGEIRGFSTPGGDIYVSEGV